MRTVPTLSLLVVSALAALAACASSEGDVPRRDVPKLGAGNPAAAGPAGTAPPIAQNFPPLPDLSPVAAAPISSRGEVLTAGPFTAEPPSIRANDRHTFEVTGKDCMTCHGTGGTASHFAFGGTIALGRDWTRGTPPWANASSGGGSVTSLGSNGYDSLLGYGSYDTSDGYGSFGDLLGGGYGYGEDDGYGSGSGCGNGGGYGDDEDDDGYGYGDDDGYGSYGDDDDDGYGGGRCGGGRGWPADRTYPSPNTGVRLVGSDGYIFDTVTDSDGNFWFKTKAEVAVPAYTGIRYGTFTVTGDTNGVACGSCHESGAADSPGRLWTWDGPTPR